MKTLLLLAAAAAPLIHADWVIEQDAHSYRMRYAIGKSALKQSIIDNKVLVSDLIADFAARTVTSIDHEKKTIMRIGLDEYLKQIVNETRNYKISGFGKYAGLECNKLSYSWNTGGVGGWGGGTGCYTRAITMPAPFDKMLERWFQVTEGTTGYEGFSLCYQSYRDGPPRVDCETLTAVQKPVAASEFVPPAGYRSVPFKRE